MYLIELSANKPSFQTIKFKDGLNFIIGGKSNEQKNKKSTYNGVGKSLMIRILHFCLGCNAIKTFEKYLEDWEFTLKFKVDYNNYTVTRKCKEQNKIFLNGKEMTVSEFNEFMGSSLFYLDKVKYKNLTYRPLISRFIRPNKYSYDNYDIFIPKEAEYARNLCNNYLLGLDVSLIDKKKELVCKKKEVTNAKKIFEKDDTIQTFFKKKEKIDVSIINLEQNIEKLKNEIDNFKIADNYYEIKKEADEEQIELNNLENDLLLMKNAVENIDKSLNIKTDVSKDKIIAMYEEAKIELNDMIVKKLEEVEEFHNKLLDNRMKRLIKQKNELKSKIKETEKQKQQLSQALDENLKVLGAFGALEEYNSLNSKLNEYKNRLEKLNDYKELIEKYKNELNNININLQQENIITNDYLKDSREVINRNILVFRELAQRFYPNKTSGIQIDNNESEKNQNRFNVSVEIQDDSSDGVNGIKIFCYDYTVMINGYNNNVRFICHDSRLFSDIDPRQKSECIKIAEEYTNRYGFQYIVTLNEDFLDTIKGGTSEEEYIEIKKIIDNNTQLHLTDNNETGKLLGIQLDLKYDE